jgi:hypothetical protein
MGCVEFLTGDGGILKHKAKLAQLKLTVCVPNDSLLLPEKYAQDDFAYLSEAVPRKSIGGSAN